MFYDNKAQIIKDQLTMKDVLFRYGFTTGRGNFICCPFHNEKTASMKIYEKDFHCFGCGEHGDVLTFVQKLFALPFPKLLKRIDSDFGLNLYADKSFDELRKSHYQLKELKAKMAREKAEREKVDSEWWAVYEEYIRLDKNKRDYRPKTPDEEWHPLFVEALQKMAYQSFMLDCIEQKKH